MRIIGRDSKDMPGGDKHSSRCMDKVAISWGFVETSMLSTVWTSVDRHRICCLYCLMAERQSMEGDSHLGFCIVDLDGPENTDTSIPISMYTA